MAPTYTDQDRATAVQLYLEHGLAEAHRRTDVPKPTLKRWLANAGHDPSEVAERAAEKTAAATQARKLDMDARRKQLAQDLMGDVERLRRQLFAPCVEKKAVVLSGGMHASADVEVVEIEREQPTFAEQVKILTGIGIGVDKIQVLTGEPSSVVEHRGIPERTPEQEEELAKVIELKQVA